MSAIGFGQLGIVQFAGAGHWNDPDMLEIGHGGMATDEYRTTCRCGLSWERHSWRAMI
jgi:alpha-galactosidase